MTKNKIYKFSFGSRNESKEYIRIYPNSIYTDEIGYGFDYGTFPCDSNNQFSKNECIGNKPFYFSVKLIEGNYTVRIKCGSEAFKSCTTVKAQSRRYIIDGIETTSGQYVESTISINIKSPLINESTHVRLKEREQKKLSWSNKLTLELNGSNPCISALEISETRDCITLFTAGNSTVVDQDDDPYASWPQLITQHFKCGVAVSNHAESGLTLEDFIRDNRLMKILSTMKAGDYLFIEFGHLDKKNKSANALDTFGQNLFYTINEVVNRRAIPILVTPINRRYFDEKLSVVNTLGDYPDLIRYISKKTGTALIDLHEMSRKFYEALGPELSKKAFVYYPPKTWFNQFNELQDNTHLNVYGATQIAQFMRSELINKVPRLALWLNDDNVIFDPDYPAPFSGVSKTPSLLSPVVYTYNNNN